MDCALTPRQQELLLSKVYKDLEVQAKSETDFDVDDYIQKFHDKIVDVTNDSALGLTYAQLLPEFIQLSLTGEKELQRTLRKQGLDLNALVDKIEEFEDINNVIKQVTPTTISEADLTKLDKDIEQDAKRLPETEKLDVQDLKKAASELVNTFNFKVSSPFTSTGLQTLKVRDLNDEQIASIYFPGQTPSEYQIQKYRENNGNKNTQVKDTTQDFYYNFFELFQDKFLDNQNPETITINEQTGFKIAVVKKDKIDVDKARLDEQEFAKSQGIAAYNAGVAAVITDNEGNILYFDENYWSSTNPDFGKPLYYNLRKVDLNNGRYTTKSQIQSVKEIAANRGITESEADKLQQEELKALYNIRKYVKDEQKGDIVLDISGVSRGVLNIRLEEKGTRIEDVDWDNSDIKLNIDIAKIDAEELGEVEGGVYVKIPGYRSIPVQADNITDEDMNKVLDLLFDDSLVGEDGLKVPAETKIKLAKHIIYTKPKVFEFYEEDEFKVRVKLRGKEVTNENRQEILDFLKQPYISKEGRVSPIHYTTFGQYSFSEPKPGQVFEEFAIENGVVKRYEVDLKKEFIPKHGSLAVVPNNIGESKVITFLNGYMNFTIPPSEQDKLGLTPEFKKKDITPVDEIDSTKTEQPIPEVIKEIKKREVEPLEDIDPTKLMSHRLNPMKSTPKEIEDAKRWWKEHPLSKYIKYEELFNVVNSNAWAEFTHAGIKLYAGSNHTVLYHEAFHAFTQHFLSKKEKLSLYNEAANLPQGKKAIKAWAKKKGIKSNQLSQHQKYLAIEELLAEDFRRYVLSDGNKVLGQRPERNNIFRRILNFLKKIFAKITSQPYTGDTSMLKIEEIYAKLYVGNIHNYSPSQNNAFFGETALYSKPEDVEGVDNQDSKLVIESVDSLLSLHIDEQNAAIQDIVPGSTPYTNALFNDPDKFLARAYVDVKNKLKLKANELEEQAKDLEGIYLEDIQRKINLLDNVIDNFGSYEENTGWIGYHKQKSPFILEQVKNMDKDAFRTTKADIDTTRAWTLDGNELSTIKSASDRVHHLMSSIFRYEGRAPELNELGFPILMTPSETFGKLKAIIGEEHSSPREMKQAMEKALPENPWLKPLLLKLGSTSTKYTTSQNLWTGMWYAFHVSTQRLHSTLILNTKDTDGNDIYEVRSGHAATVFRKVEQDFKGDFKVANHPNKYILDGGPLGNVLDTGSVIKDFKGKLNRAEGKFQFLRAVGFPLTNTSKIKEALEGNNIGVRFMFNKLEQIHALNIPVRDAIEMFRQTIPTPIEGQFLKTENSNVNAILSLEATYSGKYSNFSVLTATGNVVQEYSKMSTIAEQVHNINKVNHFDELRAIPEMSFLDYANNPRVTSLTLLKSLFRYDKNTDTFHEKREGATLRFDLADGVQNIEDERSNSEFSTATSEASKYDRMLQDLYAMVLEGKPSAINPADKNTITIITANQLLTEASNKNLYIDFNSFGKTTPEGRNLGVQQAYNILLPHVEGELKEMALIKSGKLKLNIPGYTTPDSKGNVRGKDWSVFDDMFSPETKNQLQAEFELTGQLKASTISPELRDKMLADLTKYVNITTEDTKVLIDKMLFIDDNLKSLTTKDLATEPTKEELENLVLKAYTVNKLIHNIEHTILFYGSPAQFKDLDKRSPGINSTGRMFRTDQDMMDHLNTIVGRPYQEKYFGPIGKGLSYNPYTPTMQAAIIADDVVTSDYITNGHYEAEFRKDLKKRGLSQEKIDKIIERDLAPYSNMETGDAQGWISFDTYRALSIASDRWSPQQEALFQQIVNEPNSVKIGEIAEYFPTRKYQYFGPLAVSGLHATAFHKFSLFPLIPTVIQGTKLEDLHKMMMEQGIDYATYQTGSKVSTLVADGSKTADNLFKENKEVNTGKTFTKNPVFLKYLKDQLDINSEFKNKVIFSTQLRKLILEGLVAEGIPVDFKPKAKDRQKEWDKLIKKAARAEDPEKQEEIMMAGSSEFYRKYKTYEDKIGRLVKFRTAQLKKEIGLTEDELGTNKKGIDKLVKFIKKELQHQDLSDHELNFIGVTDKGELLNDLSISPSAAQIEKLLNSIVNNRLVRQKVNGEALVQMSNSLFEPKNPSEVDLTQWGQKGLRTYRRDPKTGKTLGMDVKVALQGKFKHLVNLTHLDGKKVAVFTTRNIEGKVIRQLDETRTIARLNELIQDEAWRSNQDNLDMITMVGVRIPVQGLNSMENMVIKEFLPEAAGNIIVPPIEIVAKSGSDFDIDKLTVMMPAIAMIGSKPEIVREAKGDNFAQNLDRVDVINTEIKELNKQKRELKIKHSEEFKALSQGLTEEDKIEKDKLFTSYWDTYHTLDREIKRVTNLWESLSKLPVKSEANEALIRKLENKHADLTDEFDALPEFNEVRKEFGSKIFQENREKLKAKQTAESKPVLDKLEKLAREKAELSGEAIENSLMFGIRDILELEHNFISLITPNSTDLVQPLSKTLAKQDKSRYSDTKTVFGESRFSPTRYFEVSYNVNKHEFNSVGKETLGLGAVGNTWNTIFNRVGAYLDTDYVVDDKNNTQRATILMDHNKRTKGEGISLSHLYDVNNENKIADIINQLMNGWVDVAKDSWIFDIQGNKQVTPVLMFLLEAGVTFENAVYFASNPLVKQYVTEQKIAQSSFAKPLKLNPKDANLYKDKAKMEMLESMGLDHVIKTSRAGKPYIDNKVLYRETLKLTHGKKFDKNLMTTVSKMDLLGARASGDARAAFLHYLELEKLAGKITEVKLNLSYDTSRSNTLFDAAETEAKLRKAAFDSAMPEDIVIKILKESPIGSFRVADLQLKLWSKLFPIRNNPAVNRFLVGELQDFNKARAMAKLYGSTERYVENFKNDLAVKMFTDARKKFDPNAGEYKELPVVYTDERAKGLSRGVSVVEGTMYVNKKVLDTQRTSETYSAEKSLEELSDKVKEVSYKNVKLAPVPKEAFTTSANYADEFNKFSMEREYLRAKMPYTEYAKTEYFKYKDRINQERYKGKADPAKISKITYEEILRDQALDNIYNNWKLFKSHQTMADKLFEIKDMHPGLEGRYNIVRDLIMSQLDEVNELKEVIGSFKNIVLRDNRVPNENMDIYEQNVRELADIGVPSVLDQSENQRIAEFFTMLPQVGLLQSGLDTKTGLSFMRAMPMDGIAEMIKAVTPYYEKILDNPTKARQFLNAYNEKFKNVNAYNNVQVRRRFKNYSPETMERTTPEAAEEVTRKVLNVYAGTRENVELSNFAKRPVTLGDGVTYPTVEHAYQISKLQYASPMNVQPDEVQELAKNPGNYTAAQAKKLSRQIVGLDTKRWDEDSSDLMETIVEQSFEQNPEALKVLLATGNATLTHTQDKTKWRTEFPRILMNVRTKLAEDVKTPEAPDNPESVQLDLFADVPGTPVTTLQMSEANIEKILAGTKTSTVRKTIEAGGNIAPRTVNIVNFGDRQYAVFNRGYMTVEEAGGKKEMMRTEGVTSESEFMFQQTRDWINGKGAMYVYIIMPLDQWESMSEEDKTNFKECN